MQAAPAVAPAVEGWGEYIGIRAAVLGAIGGFVYYIYETGWGAPTLGGTEVNEINAYLAESCADVESFHWGGETADDKTNEAAVVQFESDIIAAIYNRDAVTKYFQYPSGLGGWLHREIDGYRAQIEAETEAQAETAKDTAWGAGIGALAAGLFTAGLGAPIGALIGGLIGHKVGTDKQYKIQNIQQPQITPEQAAMLTALRAKILAKQAACGKDWQQWEKEANQDFRNIIDYMATQIVLMQPTVITHDRAASFYQTKQSTLPPAMAAYDIATVNAWIDKVQAAYKVPTFTLTDTEMKSVQTIVTAYLTMRFYQACEFSYQMGDWRPLTDLIIACRKAGLSDNATLLALAPFYYLTRVAPFTPNGVYPDNEWTKSQFTSLTIGAAMMESSREITIYTSQYLDGYYIANPDAGPLFSCDNMRYWYIQTGWDKRNVNEFANTLWSVQQSYCKVNAGPYIPA